MKIILYLLAWITLALISIGDSLIALFSLLFQIFFKLWALIRKVSIYIGVRLVKFLQSIAQFLQNLFILFDKKQKLLRNHLTKKKIARKKRTLQILPTPIVNKLKYFLIGVIFSFLFLFLPLLFYIFLQDLPHPRELTTRQIPQTTKIFDRNGILLYEIYASQNRTLVPLSQIPKHLQQATLAIEDKNFYNHPGFDIASILRAVKENATRKGILQGGSTITQQLIKSSMLTPEKSWERKIKELILAFWAERLYTKEQILEMYFNQVPYGGTAWGVEAASEVYFNKEVKDLTLAESAFLAGITAAPTLYSPYSSDPTKWKNRQKEVLKRMVSLGYISQKQADEAIKQKLSFKSQQVAFRAPHFVNYIKDLLVKKYGLAMVEKGGLHVITTLDLKLQEKVEKIVAEEVEKSKYLNLTNGAALVTNPQNGDILVMVGSKDFSDPNGGNVNITTSLQQPGSTVKVITYSAALSRGYTATSILQDTPASFTSAGGTPYTPVNYDGKYRGPVTLRTALASSLNLPAVKTLQQIGIQTMIRLGRDMGITTWDKDEYGLSLTLGAAEVTMLDMATVNGTLANLGHRVDLNPIIKITTSRGYTLEEKNHISSRQVLKEGVAFIISDILADNSARSLAFGTSSPLVIPGHTVSVKTGTSDYKRDNWAIGYTPDYVVTVWVGNNDNSPMSPTLASGITGAAPIWQRIMILLLQGKPNHKQAIPDDVVAVPCNGKYEYFLKGTEKNFCKASTTPTVTVRQQ